jgi:hypothetical protein
MRTWSGSWFFRHLLSTTLMGPQFFLCVRLLWFFWHVEGLMILKTH